MNIELVNKYKRALDLANSNENLHQYIQLIREVLYKLLQTGYTATIDEIVWAECFVNRDKYEENEDKDKMMILKNFTTEDWSNYPESKRFTDDSNPMIAVKQVDGEEFIIIVGGDGILLLLSDSDKYYCSLVDTSNLHKRFAIVVGNEICILADKYLILIELVEQLEYQLGICFDDTYKFKKGE